MELEKQKTQNFWEYYKNTSSRNKSYIKNELASRCNLKINTINTLFQRKNFTIYEQNVLCEICKINFNF